MSKDEKWLQALGLLYTACEPLTYDCRFTPEEINLQRKNIIEHTYYCLYVRSEIEKGSDPLGWDEWNRRNNTILSAPIKEAEK